MTSTITARDGTPASRLAFGAMQFGGKADADASRALFEACRAEGVNHFDTAWVYTEGESEKLLGQLAAAERDSLVIATKVSYPGGGDRQAILDSFDESRRRLGMDVVDILYLHRWDPDTPLEETFETLVTLKEGGFFRYLGVSNYAAWQVMKAQAVANIHGITIDILQPMYNLVKRQAEVEILPMCASEGIDIAPYSPLGGGLLSGKYGDGGATGRLTESDVYRSRYAPEWMHGAAVELARIADELGTHPATLAVAWAARHPAGPMPIISASSPDQLAPSLAALHFEMDDALYAQLSALSPAPPPATDRLEEA